MCVYIQVSFTEAFRGGPEEKKNFVSVLLRNKAIELDLILKYCRLINPPTLTSLMCDILPVLKLPLV